MGNGSHSLRWGCASHTCVAGFYVMPPAHRRALSSAVIHLSVCLSVPCPFLKNGAFYVYGYYRTLTGNPMLEVEHTGDIMAIWPPEVASVSGDILYHWGDTL